MKGPAELNLPKRSGQPGRVFLIAAAKDSEFNLGDTTKDLTRALADRYLGDNSANSLGLGDNTSQVQACESARGDQTSEVVIFGLAGAAALVVGLIRRYQPTRAT